MEKISGILPSTARVTTVDLKGSGISRSGMPTFGRETAPTSFDRRALNTSQLAMERQNELMSLRDTKMDPKSEIVKQMADSFFMNKQKTLDSEAELAAKELASASTKEISDALRKSIESQVEADSDDPSVGSRLDVQA